MYVQTPPFDSPSLSNKIIRPGANHVCFLFSPHVTSHTCMQIAIPADTDWRPITSQFRSRRIYWPKSGVNNIFAKPLDKQKFLYFEKKLNILNSHNLTWLILYTRRELLPSLFCANKLITRSCEEGVCLLACSCDQVDNSSCILRTCTTTCLITSSVFYAV